MRRLVATVALTLCLFGCDTTPSAVRVELLTGVDSCWAGGETGLLGLLVIDADYGTRFIATPVMWPLGFVGVRVGAEVEVHDGTGKLVATTGRDYYLSRGPVFSPENAELMERVGAFPAAANCGYAWDLVDCGPGAPPSPYCDRAPNP